MHTPNYAPDGMSGGVSRRAAPDDQLFTRASSLPEVRPGDAPMAPMLIERRQSPRPKAPAFQPERISGLCASGN